MGWISTPRACLLLLFVLLPRAVCCAGGFVTIICCSQGHFTLSTSYLGNHCVCESKGPSVLGRGLGRSILIERDPVLGDGVHDKDELLGDKRIDEPARSTHIGLSRRSSRHHLPHKPLICVPKLLFVLSLLHGRQRGQIKATQRDADLFLPRNNDVFVVLCQVIVFEARLNGTEPWTPGEELGRSLKVIQAFAVPRVVEMEDKQLDARGDEDEEAKDEPQARPEAGIVVP